MCMCPLQQHPHHRLTCLLCQRLHQSGTRIHSSLDTDRQLLLPAIVRVLLPLPLGSAHADLVSSLQQPNL